MKEALAPPPSGTDDGGRARSLRQLDLLDFLNRASLELTEEQRSAMRDLGALVQRDMYLTTERRPAPLKPRAHSRSIRNILAAFGLLLAGLVVVSVMTLRIQRKCIADFRALVEAHEAFETLPTPELRGRIESLKSLVEAEADRPANLLLASGVIRFLVVALALYALLRAVRTRDDADESLRRSHEEAWNAAEDRRIAQAEAVKLGERLSAVLDHIDVGVTMMELDGTMSVYNRAAERIHGAWREQMERLKQAGEHRPMLEDEKTVIPHGESPLGRALKGQTVSDAHIFFRTPFRPNGYHLSVSAAPLRDHRGLMSGAVLMFSERQKRPAI